MEHAEGKAQRGSTIKPQMVKGNFPTEPVLGESHGKQVDTLLVS